MRGFASDVSDIEKDASGLRAIQLESTDVYAFNGGDNYKFGTIIKDCNSRVEGSFLSMEGGGTRPH
jgi:hypothetical protein